MVRRHGWQLPLHPLQVVGMAVFVFLVAAFYVFLGPYLGNKIVEKTFFSLFSFVVISAAVLYVRCTAIDPTDRTEVKRRKGKRRGKLPKINYAFVLWQVLVRLLKIVENKILSKLIRRNYLEQWNHGVQLEPLLPFPLVIVNDAVSPQMKDDDISYCALCDLEVKRHSKHCRSCDRCVDGFDHHCRWLNNCVGRKNYTTFVLLMFFIMLMLILEGGTGVAVFVRCFADWKGIEKETEHKFHIRIPKAVLATVSMLLAGMTGYTAAALGQLFFFHVVLIRKGMKTYEYILAMREEEKQSFDPFDDYDSSSDEESTDFGTPEKPTFLSRFLCSKEEKNESARRLSVRIDKDSNIPRKKDDVQINPWKLIKMSKEKALVAAENARERIRQKLTFDSSTSPMKPLPLELKQGPLVEKKKHGELAKEATPIVPKGWLSVSSPSMQLSSPRRRFSGSPSPRPQKYRNNFDLKLTEVSKELETHISKHILCSILSNDEDGASPS